MSGVAYAGIEFREAVYVGRSPRSARKLEIVADNFTSIDEVGGVSYRITFSGSTIPDINNGSSDGMLAVSLFQAAVVVIRDFIWMIEGELRQDRSLKLFVEVDGVLEQANMQDIFVGLQYPTDEYSYSGRSG